MNPLILIAKAKAAMDAFQRMLGKEQMSFRSEVSKQERWCSPPIGHYKVNVDDQRFKGPSNSCSD